MASVSAQPVHHVVTRREATAIVQQLLRAHGHPTVPVDGVAGPGTVMALRHFQAAHGLPVTGGLDRATVVALRTRAPAAPSHVAHAPDAGSAGGPGVVSSAPAAAAGPAAPHGAPATAPHHPAPPGHDAIGLTPSQQASARRVVVQACQVLLDHAQQVHYSEGPNRWQGIAERLRIAHGQYLTESDCSSTATWILWNALTHVIPAMPDIVNGEGWKGGYTGTIAAHGKPVVHDASIRVGDLLLYGAPPAYEHVTVALGGGVCFSHGSEAGPFKLAIDYRPDRGPTRRFL